MLAREDAVSAVSLPAKNADSSRHTSTMTRESQSFAVIAWRILSARKARTSAGSTSFSTKAWPMPRTRMKVSLPRLTFLSCAMSSISRSTPGTPPGTSLNPGRQADRCKMGARARGIGRGDQACVAPENSNASAMPSATASPCSSRPEKPARGFERVAEGVAEIEQRALAGLALVARDDAGLAAAADRDGVLARAGAAGKHVLPVRFQPGEERGVAEQAEFGHLGIAGAEFARRQRVEQRGVGDHQNRLVEGADQILAVRAN